MLSGRSMSRSKGCSPDNAASEGISKRLEIELSYSRDWRDPPVEQFIKVVDCYFLGMAPSESKSLSARSNTGKVPELQHRLVQDFSRTPWVRIECKPTSCAQKDEG